MQNGTSTGSNIKKIFSAFVLLLTLLTVSGQTVTLTFSGQDGNFNRCQLNREVIINHTKNWQETIYWLDTTLVLQNETGVGDFTGNESFFLLQNNPNPFNGSTEAELTLTESGPVTLVITDVNGRIVKTQNFASLQIGRQHFRVQVAAAGIYFLTANQNGHVTSIKMVNNESGADNLLEYIGLDQQSQDLTQTKSGAKGECIRPFSFGDQMEYFGYATINGTEMESQHIQQQLTASEHITLQFDEAQGGLRCHDFPTLTDVDGNTYNTVQIGQQCWMKENLRTTRYADGTLIPMGSTYSSDSAYRYCPDNNENYVTEYGYLYNWPAVMYNTASSISEPSGVQGVCPNGWHLPSDAEWTQLTNHVMSLEWCVAPGCSAFEYDSHIYCIAKSLASTTGWHSCSDDNAPGNNPEDNNATGFSAVPAGSYNRGCNNFGDYALFWSTTEGFIYFAYGRYLYYAYDYVYCNISMKEYGFSVRCIKD